MFLCQDVLFLVVTFTRHPKNLFQVVKNPELELFWSCQTSGLYSSSARGLGDRNLDQECKTLTGRDIASLIATKRQERLDKKTLLTLKIKNEIDKIIQGPSFDYHTITYDEKIIETLLDLYSQATDSKMLKAVDKHIYSFFENLHDMYGGCDSDTNYHIDHDYFFANCN